VDCRCCCDLVHCHHHVGARSGVFVDTGRFSESVVLQGCLVHSCTRLYLLHYRDSRESAGYEESFIRCSLDLAHVQNIRRASTRTLRDTGVVAK
jgi:hypothetical protein